MEAIFITYDKFPKIVPSVSDPDKVLLTFKRRDLNLITLNNGIKTRQNKSDIWVDIVKNREVIDELRSDKRKDKIFWEVDEIPTSLDWDKKTNKKLSPNIPQPSGIQLSELKKKAERLGELKALLVKKDGSFSKNASEADIAEYEGLKTELN